MTDLDGAGHVGARPAEVEEGEDGHSDGEPVDERDVVDQRVDVCGGEVEQRREALVTRQ